MENDVIFPQSDHGFHQISAIFYGKKRLRSNPKHIVEILNSLLVVVVKPCICMLGH